MGGSIVSEDIKDFEKTFLREDNVKIYRKKCRQCKDCLDCIPSFFLTVRYYYNLLY